MIKQVSLGLCSSSGQSNKPGLITAVSFTSKGHVDFKQSVIPQAPCLHQPSAKGRWITTMGCVYSALCLLFWPRELFYHVQCVSSCLDLRASPSASTPDSVYPHIPKHTAATHACPCHAHSLLFVTPFWW